ncbi:Uncharacterised protein [Klebsiella pneumoniae]|jgi:hypothetical protein|nr:Uncharacterised protein [Klebsiella michiganensis]SLV61812.1 Uncharacterised protein [Klebsiella pneumoniae]SLV81572.1 Uncharacterised protein [Klebsiella pneumoniae]SLX66795.1 Uncharacterised protein [Klebsiella pneumoniae]SLX89081.1 Uncharacterised protein [Klebsiella pneumoniae]
MSFESSFFLCFFNAIYSPDDYQILFVFLIELINDILFPTYFKREHLVLLSVRSH